MVDIWGSWCPDCVAEARYLSSAYDTDTGKVRFLGVDTADDPTQSLPFEPSVSPPVHYPSVFDPDSKVMLGLNYPGPPETAFVDTAGIVVHIHNGAYRSTAAIQADIARYLHVTTTRQLGALRSDQRWLRRSRRRTDVAGGAKSRGPDSNRLGRSDLASAASAALDVGICYSRQANGAYFDEGHPMSGDPQPVSYEGVPVGVPLLSSSGVQFGTLAKVLEIPSEDLFDGVVVKTGHGPHGYRFVDRDQISEITTEYIKCDLDDTATQQLPEPSHTASFDADPRYGEGNSFREWVHRSFGHGGWKAEK